MNMKIKQGQEGEFVRRVDRRTNSLPTNWPTDRRTQPLYDHDEEESDADDNDHEDNLILTLTIFPSLRSRGRNVVHCKGQHFVQHEMLHESRSRFRQQKISPRIWNRHRRVQRKLPQSRRSRFQVTTSTTQQMRKIDVDNTSTYSKGGGQ